MKALIPVGAGLVLAFAPMKASAQPTDSVAAAEQLFEQARALFDQGNFAEACPRFGASYKLDPALGTLLNMATCYEMLGHIASAWGHYREVVVHAQKVGDQQRIDIARARIAALEPRLPKLTIKAPNVPLASLIVTRDDAPLDIAVLGASIFVDPGQHAISASAPGYKPFTTTITIKEGEAQEVQLALEAAPNQPAPQTGGITTIIREESDPGKTRRLFALTLGGAGAVALVTGVSFGFAARDSWQSAFDDGLCNRTTLECTPEGQDLTRTARTRALVANIVGGAGIAMLAGGAILYLTAPTRADVSVTPTNGGAAVSFGGHW
ncbi:MAG TPA: PEGA domain-containing protein [Kofleriaceae bacterium]|nr:PEGA domain-containing protein [Kofleriaceae bacterium]